MILFINSSKRIEIKEHIYFYLVLVGLGAISSGYMLELLAKSTEEAITAVRFQTFSCLTVVALMGFCFEFIHKKINFKKIILPIGIFALIIITLGLSNGYHNLYYSNPTFDSTGIHFLQFDPQIVYYIAYVFKILLLVIGSVVLIVNYFQTKRNGNILMFLTVFSILSSEVIYFISGIMGQIGAVYLSPPTIFIATLIVYITVLKYDILDIIPSAKKIVFDNINEIYILLDENKHVISYNGIAENVIPGISNLSKYKTIDQLPTFPAQLNSLIDNDINSIELPISRTQALDYYKVNKTNIYSDKKEIRGYLLIFNPITEKVVLMNILNLKQSAPLLPDSYLESFFFEIVEPYYLKSQNLGVTSTIMIISINNLDFIEETYGNNVLPLLINQISEKLKTILRNNDVFSRYQDEKLILFFPTINKETSELMKDRIKSRIEHQLYSFDRINFSISISVGVAFSSKDALLKNIIEEADMNCFLEKQKLIEEQSK
jgi:diguanylate cyclase (GGDEF)-like protein